MSCARRETKVTVERVVELYANIRVPPSFTVFVRFLLKVDIY